MDNNLKHIFWTWALKRYDDPGLRECLLALQESCGLVVVEALFFAWLAEQGRQLEFVEARRMEEVITPWVDKVLLPLRRQRVEWTNNKETESLRREALRLELEAEKMVAELFWETFEPPLGEARPVAYRLNLSLITSLSSSDDVDRLIAAFER